MTDRRTVAGQNPFAQVYGPRLPTCLGKLDADDPKALLAMTMRMQEYIAQRAQYDGERMFRIFVQVVEEGKQHG